MKKRNPIRETVIHYVMALKRRQPKPKLTLFQFFKDLENRGPWGPNSDFEKWTQKIRSDMQEAGTWEETPEEAELDFVAEYISRLQRLYLRSSNSPGEFFEILKGKRTPRFTRETFVFRMIYQKIRVWGLRTKRFRLQHWPKGWVWVHLHTLSYMWSIDFSKKRDSGEDVVRYEIGPWETFFTKEIFNK